MLLSPGGDVHGRVANSLVWDRPRGWFDCRCLPVWAQSPSLTYYAAQLGGGSLGALAGGLAGTLVGSWSGGLIGTAIDGATIGFGLGASLGATVGIVQIASAYGVRGDPKLALVGALAGSIVAMVFLPDSAYPQRHWQMDATSKEFRIRIRSSVVLKSLINPVTLAALGATIGYNLRTKKKEHTTAIAMPIFALQF